MALTPEQIEDIASDWFSDEWAVARAIKLIEQVETEVRKQDTDLIRQMLEALAKASVALRIGHDKLVAIDETAAAITAARERLGDEPTKAQPAIHPATVAACITRLEQGGQSAAVSIPRHHFEQKGNAT